MKKVLTIIASFALLLMTASCIQEPEIPDVPDKPDPEKPDPKPDPEPTDKEVTFNASFEALPDGSQMEWVKGAQISLFDGTSVQTLTNTAENGAMATFTATVPKDANAYFAFSPADDQVTITANSAAFKLEAAQSAAAKFAMPAVAKATGSTLVFRPLLATISFSVDIDGADKVVFNTNGVNIAGDISVDYSGEDPVVTGTVDEITLAGPFEKGKTYSIAMIPAAIESYTIVVYSGENAVAHLSGEAVDIPAGANVSLSAIVADIPIYRIVKMLVWGGTGPEYDCTKVYNMMTKAGCFNDEDGRGITALADNYLVFGSDGVFTNYAGEDGRNWWFVFNGSQNTETGKDVDLRAFYDLWPLYQGTWSSDAEGVFTFTKPDGTTTTAQYLPAGEYKMPGTAPELFVTIEKEALMFTITGGKDNWNGENAWNDYGVFACHPRALFVEFEKMPDGFKVPEAACTRDDEFQYVAPEEPEAPELPFSLEDMAGRWNVYGVNKSPYGIWVLGGSGDDPAFVSPIDKSWDWDDSIWRESDNGLVIKINGYTDQNATGTTNWWSGADGQFWNYKWKKTEEDLSRFYNKIPKGEKTFTLEFATMEVTLGNGEKAKMLTPGVHEFAYKKTLTVPEGCFALAFHLMDPIAATADRWSDVDRFVNAPLEYVIIFEKEQ